MREFIKKYILIVAGGLLLGGVLSALGASITPAFPTSLNNFNEGDVIEEEDWNAIEAEIGVDGSSVPSSLNYQLTNSASVDPGHLHTADAGAWETYALNVLRPTNTSAAIVINAASSTITDLVVSDSLAGSGFTTAFDNRLIASTTVPNIGGCSSGQVVEWNGSAFVCATDDTGAAAGAPGAWELRFANTLSPTNTAAGIFVTNSSTISDLRVDGALNATSSLIDTLTVSNTITGSITGNAGTATALAANGGNCSAGSYPLGVDASGAVESCTDATTEIDSAISTHAAINNAHHDLVTLAGTPNYLTLSGQEITLTVLDVSDDTNLAVTAPIVLTDDTISIDQTADYTWSGLHTFTDARPAVLNATSSLFDNATTTGSFHATELLIGNTRIATSTTVCEGAGCSYQTIQGAIDAVGTSTAHILVGCGEYSPFTIGTDNVVIRGSGFCTNITVGADQDGIAMKDDTQRAGIVIQNLKITGSPAGSGRGINANHFAVSKFADIFVRNTQFGVLASTTGTHYNDFENIRIDVSGTDSYGFNLSDGANDNNISHPRINCDSSGTGVVVDAHGNSLIGINVETGCAIGIDIQSGGNDTTIISPYLEGNVTNLRAANNVEGLTVVGGFIADGSTANITDNGAQRPWINTRLQYDSYLQGHFNASTTIDTDLFVANVNENEIGIGIAEPLRPLHLSNASPIMRFGDSNATNNVQTLAFQEFGSESGGWDRGAFVGFGSSSNNTFSITNEESSGHIAFDAGLNGSTRFDFINASTTGIDTLTVNTSLTIPADSIEEPDLEVTNSPTDNYILSYDSATDGFTWVEDQTGAGGSSAWEKNGSFTNAISPTTTNAGIYVDANATTTATLHAAEIRINNWDVPTSTTVCASGCQYTDIDTALDSAPTGTVVELIDPLYNIGTTGITWQAGKTMSLVGRNASSTEIYYTGTGTALNVGDSAQDTRYVRIEDIVIQGTNSGAIGLGLDRVKNSTFSNIFSKGFTASGAIGFDLDGTNSYTGDNSFYYLKTQDVDIGVSLTTVPNSNHFYGFTIRAATKGFHVAGNGNTFHGGLVGDGGAGDTGYYIVGDENYISGTYCEALTTCVYTDSTADDNYVRVVDVETNTTMWDRGVTGNDNDVQWTGADSNFWRVSTPNATFGTSTALATGLTVSHDGNGGDVGLVLQNSNYNNTADTVTLAFRGINLGGVGNAGKIVSVRESAYNESAGTHDSALAFYTAQNDTDTEWFRINQSGGFLVHTTTSVTPYDSNIAIFDGSVYVDDSLCVGAYPCPTVNIDDASDLSVVDDIELGGTVYVNDLQDASGGVIAITSADLSIGGSSTTTGSAVFGDENPTVDLSAGDIWMERNLYMYWSGGPDVDTISKTGTNAIDVDARWQVADGTVGAPGLSFTSDDDNGVYRIGADHLAISAGGVLGLEIQEVGSVTTATSSGVFHAPEICIGNDCQTSWPAAGGGAFAWTDQSDSHVSTSTVVDFISGFMANGSSTAQDLRVATLNASSTSLDTLQTFGLITESQSVSALTNYINLQGTGAFAGSEPAIVFSNSAGSIETARLSSKPGSGYTNSEFTLAVADSSKNLQDRIIIDVNGLVTIPQDLTVTTAATFNGSLEIPNAAGPTLDAVGEVALDTTSNNFVVATSTTGGGVVFGSATTTLYSFVLASTSPDFINGGIIDLPSHFLQQEITSIMCHVDGGTSAQIFLSDGTNDTNTITCTTTRNQYDITQNGTFTAYEAIRSEYGTVSGAVDYLIIRVLGYRTAN